MTPEKRERAVKWLTEEVRSLRMAPKINGCGPENWQDQLEIMETCLEAVRNHFPDTRKMVPLTVEQLRKMDGKPVWVRVSENWRESGIYEGWMLVRFHETDDRVRAYTYDTHFGATFHAQQDYGISWWAYAYHPAHIDREAWVSVEDRLPEPNSGAYWIAKKKNNGEWQMKMALFCDYGCAMPIDAKTDVTWRDWDYTKIVNVSHWMPLPDPPAELEKRLRGVPNGQT